jgi:adenylate cyclase
MGPGEHAERIALFEQALRLDPTAILALTGLAEELIRFTCIYDLGYELPRAGSLLTQAMAIDPDHCEVLDTLAYLHYHQGRYNESISVNRRLIDYYPNHSAAYNQIGGALIRMGEAEEAITMIQTAIRWDPRNRYNFSRYENMGLALLMLERDEESIVWLQRAVVANPNNDPTILAKHNVWMAAAFARLGRCDDAHRAVAEANRIWPHGTVRMHAPGDSPWRVYAAQIERFQAALRLAGQRDHAEEDADFGVASDTILHACLSGLTPTTAKGVRTICTAELELLLAERTPIVIDSLMYSWGRSIPGAVGLKRAGWGSSYTDAAQDRLARKMHELTAGDHATPIVAVGWNSERFDGRNLALRLVALGYTNVDWYRGGREAWEVAGLPETELVMHDW